MNQKLPISELEIKCYRHAVNENPIFIYINNVRKINAY